MTPDQEQTIKYLLEKVAYLEDALELSMQNVAHDLVRLAGQQADMKTDIYLLRKRVEELEEKK